MTSKKKLKRTIKRHLAQLAAAGQAVARQQEERHLERAKASAVLEARGVRLAQVGIVELDSVVDVVFEMNAGDGQRPRYTIEMVTFSGAHARAISDYVRGVRP